MYTDTLSSQKERLGRPRITYKVSFTVYTPFGAEADEFILEASDADEAVSLAKEEAKKKYRIIDFLHFHGVVEKGS